MRILVANLGSTSFKYRLFDMATETQLARGGIDRIGQDGAASDSPGSFCFAEVGAHRSERTESIPDHAAAVRMCLEQLTDPETGCLSSVDELGGIGFKAVFAGSLSGVRRVDEELLAKMEELSPIAPAHNPPYAKAMRQLMSAFPDVPLVAALETAFHDSIPDAHRLYAVPLEWAEQYDIKRWGFHGASHRFIAQRFAELSGRSDRKVISCHLGGSASICAIARGKSVAASMGMSPQSGLPNNNRIGDMDPFVIPVVMNATGKSLDEVLDDLSSKSGLLGLSGLSGDCRDLEEAGKAGNERAELALQHFEFAIRSYVGSYLAVLGGADAIVFTGGIGENSQRIRSNVCRNMEWCGLELDEEANTTVSGEQRISTDDSRIAVWVIPTNEELVVGRQTVECLGGA